jgi:hypothetical protein
MQLAVIWMVLASAIVYPSLVTSQTRTLELVGEYARIDTKLTNEVIAGLRSGSDKQKNAQIRDIQKNPQNYAPPVFYLLSNVLFQRGQKDEAAFWFYAGQLRARFDANRCADSTASQAVAVLNQHFGEPINQHMFRDLQKLEILIPKVVEWDRKTPHKYDQRWINLSGMNAVLASAAEGRTSSSTPLSRPKEQWSEIAERTRRDYLDGFRKAMEAARNRHRE